MDADILFGKDSLNAGVCSRGRLPATLLRVAGLISPRMRNMSLNRDEMAGFRLGFSSLPLRLQLEMTNKCNLSCSICARDSWDKKANKLGEMSEATFASIEQYLERVSEVYLFGFGEALLSKNFFSIAERVKRSGCRTRLITNGILLTPSVCERIVRLGIDWVDISLDSADRDSLKKLRGCELGKVISGARALMSARDAAGSKKPRLGISMVLIDSNLGELGRMIALAQEIGAERLEVNNLLAYSKKNAGRMLSNKRAKAISAAFESARKAADEAGIELLLPQTSGSGFCLIPFIQLFVHWNGDVRPCCRAAIYGGRSMEKRLSPVLGNVNDEPLPALWNKPAMKALRLEFWRSLDPASWKVVDRELARDREREAIVSAQKKDLEFCRRCRRGENAVY